MNGLLREEDAREEKKEEENDLKVEAHMSNGGGAALESNKILLCQELEIPNILGYNLFNYISEQMLSKSLQRYIWMLNCCNLLMLEIYFSLIAHRVIFTDLPEICVLPSS